MLTVAPHKAIARAAEPVVAQQIRSKYEDFLGGRSDSSEKLISLHSLMWSSLLGQELASAKGARRSLAEAAHAANLDRSHLETIDAVVFGRLIENLVRYGQGSRDKTSRQGQALFYAAKALGEVSAEP
jgi:hypothetical protein